LDKHFVRIQKQTNFRVEKNVSFKRKVKEA